MSIRSVSAIDVFCGVGGLSYGLKKAGIEVKVGIDQDKSCEYAYSYNNNADFIGDDVCKIDGKFLCDKYWNDTQVRILVGCAPCQPFSAHSNKVKGKKTSRKWNLINEFLRLVQELNPDMVSMENVPNLKNQDIFRDFVRRLKELKYYVNFSVVYCPDYGIPQKRKRLVLLASKFGNLEMIPKTHRPEEYKTTRQAIGHLKPVRAGERIMAEPLHRTSKLSPLNLKRIKASIPNGTWMDWDENLRLNCHQKQSGKSYKSVYGRMSWDEPSPTITTQFYNFGTGRFGHPGQNRALTIKEAALLQSFPEDYSFFKNEEDISLTRLGTHIGNAVPVDLGYAIGLTIQNHLKDHV